MKKDKIQSMYKACSAELTSRSNDIFHLLLGEGNYDAKVMVIGFLPSAKEEEYGQNILEDERLKLQGILDPLDLTINDIYITYMMKYRPYRINDKGRIVSRSPEEGELEFFMPYLEKEISLINPELIITLGHEPLGWLLGDRSYKINTEEDQLLVTGVMGKSYKLYPLYPLGHSRFKNSLDRFQAEDKSRIKSLLFGEMTDEESLFKTPAGEKVAGIIAGMKQPSDGQSGGMVETISDLIHEAEDEPKVRAYEKIKVSSNSEDGRKYLTMVYGGEGYVDDPVQVALERVTKVLAELGVGIHRIDLHKGNISMEKALTHINNSVGVILGVNVEWYGIGNRMQRFLDDCFFRGDERYFKNKPMMGVVFTRHSFEREAYEHLRKSWEVLGGREGVGLYSAVDTAAKLETNFDWLYGIEKKAESYFRMLSQKKGILPLSKGVEKVSIATPVIEAGYKKVSESPKTEAGKAKESVSSGLIEDYDTFVEKQQEDIKQISSLFKRKLSSKSGNKDQSVPGILKESYVNKSEVQANIQLLFDDRLKENTVIELNNQHIRAYYGQIADVNVSVTGTYAMFMKVLKGKITMQRAFMTGEVKAKGDFTLLYKFEEYFKFK